MLRKILSVGGWTLVSRVTGFLRDVLMAAVMGAGPVTDVGDQYAWLSCRSYCGW